jgi:hypothetical protein
MAQKDSRKEEKASRMRGSIPKEEGKRALKARPRS